MRNNTNGSTNRYIIYGYGALITCIVLLFAGALKSYNSSITSPDIDNMIQQKWSDNKLTPSEKTNDADFVRRLYLDLAGRIPTADEVKTFLADKSSDKRDKKIDELLNSPEFGTNMADTWMRILFTQDNIQKFPPVAYLFLKNHLADEFNKNKPYNEIVYNLISASGLATTNPEVLYYTRFQTPEDAAGATMKIFMGKQIQCAQCHHHPYENITQDDFYGIAAFFTREKTVPLFQKDALDKLNKIIARYNKQIKKARDNAMDQNVDGSTDMSKDDQELPDHQNVKQNNGKQNQKKKDNKDKPIPPQWVVDTLQAKVDRSQSGDYVPDVLVWDAVNGQIQYIPKGSTTMKVVTPKFLGGASVSGNAGIERREILAKDLTQTETIQLAREFVNRFWKHFFGYGFVNPIDDFQEKGDNSNPELLDALANEFVISNFDVKHLFKLIVSTDAYQLSSTPNESNKGDHDYFSRAVLRPMDPVQLANSLLGTSGYFNLKRFQDTDPEQIEKIKVNLIKLFVFNFNDDEMSETENFNGTITQALLLMNSDLAEKVTDKRPGNMVAQVLNDYKDPGERIDMLYLNTLSRYPTENEKKELLSKAGNGKDFYEDLQWSLLNSSEFIFNH